MKLDTLPEELSRSLGLLRQAIGQRRIVAFQYRSRHRGGVGWHRVEPEDLHQSRGAYFLLGYDLRVKDWRTFRVDRMSQMSIHRRRYEPREVFDLRDLSNEAMPLAIEIPGHPEDVPREGAPCGFLDIEASLEGDMTVVGIYRTDRGTAQFVGEAITAESIGRALAGVAHLYTYSGTNFDVPLLEALGLLLPPHSDLLPECHGRGLRGGLKRVEEQLGIPRRLPALDGSHATLLWRAFQRDGNWAALRLLLAYNFEDTVNLARLRYCLAALPLVSRQ